MWGSKAARVGGNMTPSTFFDRNSSYLSEGKVVGPVEL